MSPTRTSRSARQRVVCRGYVRFGALKFVRCKCIPPYAETFGVVIRYAPVPVTVTASVSHFLAFVSWDIALFRSDLLWRARETRGGLSRS